MGPLKVLLSVLRHNGTWPFVVLSVTEVQTDKTDPVGQSNPLLFALMMSFEAIVCKVQRPAGGNVVSSPADCKHFQHIYRESISAET